MALQTVERGADETPLIDVAPATPWYSIYGIRYAGGDPYFFDRARFPWVDRIRSHREMILEELTALMARDETALRPYFNLDMAYPPRSWKSVGFYFWKLRMHRNCEACPRISALLDTIPNLTAASLSVLEPNCNINPHHGDTNAIVRGHLGLSIPAQLPDCGFQVGPEIRPWTEGDVLLFCDAHTHSAWNHSNRRRLLFLFDVVRPEFAAETDAVCANVLASLLLQWVYQRFRQLQRSPGRLHHVLHRLLRLIVRGCLPLQRRFRVVAPLLFRPAASSTLKRDEGSSGC